MITQPPDGEKTPALLLAELRGGPKPADQREAARNAAAAVRREMLNRGLTEALGKGNAAMAERYREAITALPPVMRGLSVREEAEKIVLESAPSAGIVPVLPDESEPEPEPEPENQNLPQPGNDRAIGDAADHFRGILRSGGQGDGQDDGIDRSEQFQILESEARGLGFLYDGLEPVKEGGREHDLIFDHETGTVLKLTKPSSAAFVVEFTEGNPRISPGYPVEYLDRLVLQNEIFGELTSFVGIGGIPNNRRIVTRQKTALGRMARWDEIIRLMVDELGFTKLRHNYGIGYEDS